MEPFIGQIIMFGGNFAPRGWALCDGQLLAISQNQALFSILGTTYGGDGRTTFALPDLRGRTPVHEGQGPGLSNIRLGERGGNETTTLSVANLPPHGHTNIIPANDQGGNTDDPTSAFIAANGLNSFSDSQTVNLNGGTTTNTGSGQSFSNRGPYTAVNFIIALVGTFPSRN